MAADLFREDERFRALIAHAETLVGRDLRALCERGPERLLARTDLLQPLLVAVSLGYHRRLVDRGIAPDVVAGHSLGEITALAAAGVVTDETAVTLAAWRGELMQEAAVDLDGGMLAVVTDRREEFLNWFAAAAPRRWWLPTTTPRNNWSSPDVSRSLGNWPGASRRRASAGTDSWTWQARGTGPGWPRPGITSVDASRGSVRSAAGPHRHERDRTAVARSGRDPKPDRRICGRPRALARGHGAAAGDGSLLGVRSRAGSGALRPGQAERVPRGNENLPGGQPARRRSRGVGLTAAKRALDDLPPLARRNLRVCRLPCLRGSPAFRKPPRTAAAARISSGLRDRAVHSRPRFLPADRQQGEAGRTRRRADLRRRPRPEITPRLLDLLDKHEVCATFFVAGRRLPVTPTSSGTSCRAVTRSATICSVIRC